MINEVKHFIGDKPRIYLIDVTNRDGVQAHGVYISMLERTMINYYLSMLGVFQSEAGFPFDPLERNYLAANLDLAKQGIYGDMRIAGWARAIASDVERSAQMQSLEHINLSISTSDIMLKEKLRKSEEDIIRDMVEAVEVASQKGFKSIGVNAEDASRTRHFDDNSYLADFATSAKEAGATRIRYCDTLGYDGANSIHDRVYKLAGKVRIPIEIHCHNDLGQVNGNSIEGAMGAIDAGVDAFINVTVNGIGERAGNANLVSVILGIKFSSGLRDKDLLDPTINQQLSWVLCNYVALATGIPIPPNQPGIGSNAFAHESGIHADGALKNRNNYELYLPDEIGIPQTREIQLGSRISVGDYSGRRAMQHVLETLKLKSRDIDETLLLARVATKQAKRELISEEIKFIVDHPDEVKQLLTVNLLS